MPPTDDTNDLRRKLTHAEAVIAELRGVVTALRKQIESQQAHIHRLVKVTFGRGGERAQGPTLFDGMVLREAEVPTPAEPPAPEARTVTKRKGHDRRCKPKDLPRRREEIDLSYAEKLCACCGKMKIRIGQSTSERLDYQPMAVFVRELVRPTYACRSCEFQGHDPQIAKAALPPEPIPKSGIGPACSPTSSSRRSGRKSEPAWGTACTGPKAALATGASLHAGPDRRSASFGCI
jgi:hypothetical protein